MARTQYYRYNPETDNYERVFPTVGGRLVAIGRFLLMSLMLGVILFVAAYYIWFTPGERRLEQENKILKQQYDNLNRRVENSLQVMEIIRNRDDNLYRVMLQMEPVSNITRNAGINNERRYRELNGMSDNGLAKYVTQRVDMLERQLYAQSLSFDQLKETALSQKNKLNHIPSILPVSMRQASLSGGYGMRRDPVNGMAKFHAGIDFSASQGTPVYATADGVVKIASRKNSVGNIVQLDHGFNYTSSYAHLSEILVKEGERVKKGDKIATVGSTGKSAAPHLHYEVRFRGEPQNPVNYGFMELDANKYSDLVNQAENAGKILD